MIKYTRADFDRYPTHSIIRYEELPDYTARDGNTDGLLKAAPTEYMVADEYCGFIFALRGQVIGHATSSWRGKLLRPINPISNSVFGNSITEDSGCLTNALEVVAGYAANLRDVYGRTALHYAVLANDADLVRWIMWHCDNPNPFIADNIGKTAQDYALEVRRNDNIGWDKDTYKAMFYDHNQTPRDVISRVGDYGIKLPPVNMKKGIY